MSWIAGNWASESGETRTKEQWLAPAANSMVGMCRITSGVKLSMYEFMVIEREAESVVLWMRHFRWNMKEREAAPIRWTLIRATEKEAVFESSPEDRFKQLIYRKGSADEMTTMLVPRDESGLKPLEFKFTRAGTATGAK